MIDAAEKRLLRELFEWYRQERSAKLSRSPFKRGQVLSQAKGGMFRVVMVCTNPTANGDENGPNQYQYRVERINGDVIEAGVQLNRDSRHDYWTWELGEVDPATMGTAYFDDEGRIIIHYCNEHLRLGPCTEPTP